MIKINKLHIRIKQITLHCLIIIFASACNTSENPNCPGKGMWDGRKIRVENNSNEDILITYSTGYPDTNSMNIKNHSYYIAVEPIGTYEDATIRSVCDWERIFNESESGILMFFVFLDDLEEGESDFFFKPEIFENHTLLKRYDLTFEDIEQMDWELVYN